MPIDQDSPVFYLKRPGSDFVLTTRDGIPFHTPYLAAAHLAAEFLNGQRDDPVPWAVTEFAVPAPPIPDIQPLAQRDPRWKDDKLGFSSSTIGSHGCVITCLAMIISHASQKPITPAEVNNTLRDMNLYGGENQNLVVWSAVPQAYPCIAFEGFTVCEKDPAPTNLITYAANKPDRYAIIQIDFNPSPVVPGIQGHYILVTGGTNADGYTCNDPWHGREITIPPYYCQPGWDAARAITRVAFYGLSASPQGTAPGSRIGHGGAILEDRALPIDDQPAASQPNLVYGLSAKAQPFRSGGAVPWGGPSFEEGQAPVPVLKGLK
jgi:hypothetical protein